MEYYFGCGHSKPPSSFMNKLSGMLQHRLSPAVKLLFQLLCLFLKLLSCSVIYNCFCNSYISSGGNHPHTGSAFKNHTFIRRNNQHDNGFFNTFWKWENVRSISDMHSVDGQKYVRPWLSWCKVRRPGVHSAFQFIPKVFCGVEVWALCKICTRVLLILCTGASPCWYKFWAS